MAQTIEISPPNSLVVVLDVKGGDVPLDVTSNLVVATDSCIVIGCRSASDGPTQITFGAKKEVDQGIPPFFTAKIQVRNKKLTVKTVYADLIFSEDVASDKVTVSIWANDEKEPDVVVIGFEEA